MSNDEIELVTRGNAAAADFLRVFVAHCHMLDDIVDDDRFCDDERMIASETEWLLALTGNPFFLQHRALLVPLIIQSYNAWLDSNDWALSSDSYKRLAADVLKGFYHEVVWQVAFLCGGWPHLRAVTTRAREYDFEPCNKEGVA